MQDHTWLSDFENVRPRLLGLAYRMLGSMADAEDAVQDTFLKWEGADRKSIQSPVAWLTAACTNRCLDLLKSSQRRRIDYIGPWIPEPLQTETVASAENDLDRAESLTTAFLLLLERLTAKERAAYLLREIFGYSYEDVAQVLGLRVDACRQLVSRAARHVREEGSRSVSGPSPEQKAQFLSAFQSALSTGSVAPLAGLLAESVRLRADSGGKATAATRVLEGPHDVAKFIARVLGRLWANAKVDILEINGLPGFVVYDQNRIVTALSVNFSTSGEIDQIYIMRNPEKLRRVGIPVYHDPATGSLRLH